MIYLSCLTLDLERSLARRWLSEPYWVHQRLLRAWPVPGAEGQGAVEEGRVLYRVEMDRRPPRILVQSTTVADWERCFAGFPVLGEPAQQKRVVLEATAGQTLRFLLRANPTVRRLLSGEDGMASNRMIPGQRVGLLREEEQIEWLARKMETAGCALLEVEARDRGDQVSFKATKRVRMVHRCVEFEGYLRVNDPERLRAAVAAGIGSGKAFGFGLLSLAPAYFMCETTMNSTVPARVIWKPHW
jgi:CRISPR system Cascade subunit CasE